MSNTGGGDGDHDEDDLSSRDGDGNVVVDGNMGSGGPTCAPDDTGWVVILIFGELGNLVELFRSSEEVILAYFGLELLRVNQGFVSGVSGDNSGR